MQRRRLGYTFVEIVVTVAVLAILLTLAIGASRQIFSSAGNAGCVANLRALHTAFSGYVNDVGYWPQQPEFDTDTESGLKDYGEWWINTLKPYTSSPNVWVCPSLRVESRYIPPGIISYTPTIFDAWPRRPFQWQTMPWVVEAGGIHPGGGNVLFPDGSVRSTIDITDAWK